MIPANVLADMQAMVATTFDKLASILSREEVNTPEGPVVTWVQQGDPVPCRLAPGGLRPHERADDSRIEAVTFWRVELPVGTPVSHADRLGLDGRTFEVVADVTGRSLELAGVVHCLEVE